MKRAVWLLIACTVMLFVHPALSSAGFMDKLNEATKKLNDYNVRQQGGQGSQASGTNGADEDPDRPLHLKGQGHCKGQNTATCMDYMEVVDQCMDPLKGYRMKVTGDLIEKKLKTEKLTDEQRKNFETDLVGIREAQKNKSDNPTIAGEKNSSRHLHHITEEDQVYINAEYGKFYKKIYNKCMGADHMGIGKRTEMMEDVETISGDEAVKQLRAQRAKEDEPFNCLKKSQYVRWAIMADLMEKRMNEKKLSAKERADWEADIASLREFAETGEGKMPKPVDPSNPYRGMMRLIDQADQMTVATETAKRSQEMMDECSKKGPQAKKITERRPKSGGLVDHSKSPSNPDATRVVEKAGRGNYKSTGGDSLSSHLGATKVDAMVGYSKCSDRGIGHLAKVTADALEKKLNASGATGQKRKEWEEDIAAWRAAEKAGRDRQTPPDPENPYRWQDYVTNAERVAINKEHLDFNNKLMKECADKGKMGSPMGKKIKN